MVKNIEYIDLLIILDSDKNNYGVWDSSKIEIQYKKFLEKAKLKDSGIELCEYIQWVIVEIESWYIAGLDMEKRKKLGLVRKHSLNTDNLSKEDLKNILGRNLKMEFYSEIIENFRLDIGVENNTSLKEFIDYLCSEFDFFLPAQ